jgi:hypothetical protein
LDQDKLHTTKETTQKEQEMEQSMTKRVKRRVEDNTNNTTVCNPSKRRRRQEGGGRGQGDRVGPLDQWVLRAPQPGDDVQTEDVNPGDTDHAEGDVRVAVDQAEGAVPADDGDDDRARWAVRVHDDGDDDAVRADEAGQADCAVPADDGDDDQVRCAVRDHEACVQAKGDDGDDAVRADDACADVPADDGDDDQARGAVECAGDGDDDQARCAVRTLDDDQEECADDGDDDQARCAGRVREDEDDDQAGCAVRVHDDDQGECAVHDAGLPPGDGVLHRDNEVGKGGNKRRRDDNDEEETNNKMRRIASLDDRPANSMDNVVIVKKWRPRLNASTNQVRVRSIKSFFLPKGPKMLPLSEKPVDLDFKRRAVLGEDKDGEISNITHTVRRVPVSGKVEDQSTQINITHTGLVKFSDGSEPSIKLNTNISAGHNVGEGGGQLRDL